MGTVGCKDIGGVIIAAVVEWSVANVPRLFPCRTFAPCTALGAVL